MKRLVLTGGDEESYRAATRLSSRLIAFPDGLTRHITLRDWEWSVYDWLDARFRGVGWPGPAQDSFAAMFRRCCSESVLRTLQPPGWRKRPVIAFNEAAAAAPPRPVVAAFRANAESVTGQARHWFETMLRADLRAQLWAWMYDHMGFRSLDTANDVGGIPPDWFRRAQALTEPQ